MIQLRSKLPQVARIRAAWQAQLAVAGRTPGLRWTLLRRRHELLPRFAAYYTQLETLPRRLRRHLQRRCQQSLAGVALLLALGQAPGLAATINVTTNVPDINAADGQCSLIEAIVNANDDAATHANCAAGSGADTLVLQNSSVHTLTTVNNNTYGDTGLPVITSTITIAGNNSTIKRGSGAPDFRLFAVDPLGDLRLQKTTVSGGNSLGGGGVGIYGGSVTLTNSTVSGNSATSVGGGVGNFGGSVTLTNSTVSGNSATDDGGGMFNFDGSVTLTNSTVSGNSATFGGGVDTSGGSVTLTNSTVSGNSATFGGGVGNFGGSVTLTRTLVSGNTAAGSGNEIYSLGGSISANNYNLFGHSGLTNAQAFYGFTPTGSDITATSDGTTSTPLSAILASLANNGGPTQTHALVPGSPALDASPDDIDCESTDQRGVSRPQGTACDIGAFEARAADLACLVYAVQDTKISTSQFFTVDATTHDVTALGPKHPGADIESLALHPTTKTLYAAASADNQSGQQGFLFTVDKLTGDLISVGWTGFPAVEALAFHSDGVLWGWAKGKGLVTIDLDTGAAALVLGSSKNIAGLAWALDGSVLYAAYGSKLFVYNPVRNKLTQVATNLPRDAEALEMRPDGLLAVGVHGKNTIYAYNVTLKKVVAAKAIDTPYNDIEGIAWPQACE